MLKTNFATKPPSFWLINAIIKINRNNKKVNTDSPDNHTHTATMNWKWKLNDHYCDYIIWIAICHSLSEMFVLTTYFTVFFIVLVIYIYIYFAINKWKSHLPNLNCCIILITPFFSFWLLTILKYGCTNAIPYQHYYMEYNVCNKNNFQCLLFAFWWFLITLWKCIT